MFFPVAGDVIRRQTKSFINREITVEGYGWIVYVENNFKTKLVKFVDDFFRLVEGSWIEFKRTMA